MALTDRLMKSSALRVKIRFAGPFWEKNALSNVAHIGSLAGHSIARELWFTNTVFSDVIDNLLIPLTVNE